MSSPSRRAPIRCRTSLDRYGEILGALAVFLCDLPLCSDPVFEGAAVLAATLQEEGVGVLGNALLALL